MLLAVLTSSNGYTWEVWRVIKNLELLSAIASSNSYASFVFSKRPACIHNSSVLHLHASNLQGWIKSTDITPALKTDHSAIMLAVEAN